jgi:hypothetical protein
MISVNIPFQLPLTAITEMDQSIMERISHCAVYNNRAETNLCVELVRNYRSHPAILELPSQVTSLAVFDITQPCSVVLSKQAEVRGSAEHLS